MTTRTAPSPATPRPRIGGSKSQMVFISAAAEVAFAAMSITAALLANSVTLWTNAGRVSLETASCVLACYAVWRSNRVAAESFNYGLGKLENLASLFTSVVIFVTFLILGWNTVERLRAPVEMQGAGFGIVALAIASTANVWMFSRWWRLRNTGNSPVVDTMFVIYRNALIASAVSLITVLCGTFLRDQPWSRYLDPAGAIILGAFLLKSGIYLMKRSITPLLDGAIDESAQLEITRQLVAHFDDYEQLKKIRTRRSGSLIIIEVFLEFDRNMLHGEILERMARIHTSLENHFGSAQITIVPV